MGFCPPDSMRLSVFVEDCLRRSGNQIAPSTKTEYRHDLKHFIQVIGDIDFRTVTYQHGELFRQACLDKGNAPDTVAKKIRQVHALFQLAVKRKQLEENPFSNLPKPKSNKNKKIVTFTDDECHRLIRAATEFEDPTGLEWNLVIILALTTGMRKSEILNLIWSDIDFDEMTLTITQKHETENTWQWRLKDIDNRTVPLTDDVTGLLTKLQARSPEGYPYVFIPPARYDKIQTIRHGTTSIRNKKQWTYADARISIIHNFSDLFSQIRTKAGIQEHKTFHDLRRTAITNWFYQDLEIIEVMRLAGHSKHDTTLRYYLSVKDNLMSKARNAMKLKVNSDMLGKCLEKHPQEYL